MIRSQPAPPAARRRRSPASSASSAGPITRTTGITIYGCDEDEAGLFRALAPRWGVTPIITDAPVGEANVDLAAGNRCISVGHKTAITNATLLALSRIGVAYISTRSVGCNHIDVRFAESVGITVGTVVYSPDSVADYTLMLMLMTVRHAGAMLRRTAVNDYRLGEARGKELRDLTVGVIGAGRIGTAVIDRLGGFGCPVLAHDDGATAGADRVALHDLLLRSDIVTLHTPLNANTHHLLNRERIDRLKPGAFVINTGRGGLVETEALIAALESGRLGGAALDVLEGEEGIFYADRRHERIDSTALLRLQRLPNVLISPHTAYYTDHALRDTVENSLSNCAAFAGAPHQHG
jgi:D-specific alpha-keto acid dehydrogenase